MKRLYPNARKQRQLKNRLDQYREAILSNSTSMVQSLQKKITSLLRFGNRNLFKQLATLGLVVSASFQLKAQDILLNPPITVDTNTNYYPLDWLGTDPSVPAGESNLFNLISGVAYTSRFIDVDQDGDLDAFYMIGEEGCGNCYPNTSSYNRLLFQENISLNNTNQLYADPQLILSAPIFSIPLPFELFDFDQDGDYDLMINLISDFQIYENTSSLAKSFTFNQPFSGATSVALFTQLVDIDADGYDDIVQAIPDIDEVRFEYLPNNGSTVLFPFGTTFQPLTGATVATDTIEQQQFTAAHFLDIDNDGDNDLLLQGFFEEDDLTDPYNYFPTEKRLIYYKNSTTTNGYQFTLPSEQIAERDIETNTGIGVKEFTFFNPVDFDTDGDYDIIENRSADFLVCNYCGYYASMLGVYFRENVIEEITAINQQQQAIDIAILGNPSNQNILVQFKNEAQEQALVQLFDMAGRKVYSQVLTNNQLVLEKGDLSNGLYAIKIQIGQKVGSEQILFVE